MNEIYFLVAITLFGAMLGSFASLLIWRLHFEEDGIFLGRSQCPRCKVVLGVKNLVPIFSWLFQWGRCHGCGDKISVRYPLLELVFGGVFFVFAQAFYGADVLLPLLVFAFFVLVLFFYDLWFFEVDVRVVGPAILLAFGWAFFRELSLFDFMIGGVLGAGFYAVQYFASGGKWVGFGDVWLGGFMGLLLGYKLLLLAMFLAYLIGASVSVYLLLFKNYTRKSALPMGAFLMPALLLFLYGGEGIWGWYWGLVLGY